MAERVVSAQISDEERNTEMVLRPQTLDEYVGQERMKESLKICIQAAKQRNEALDHTIFYGPPGLGKTTMAHVLAQHAGYEVMEINARYVFVALSPVLV